MLIIIDKKIPEAAKKSLQAYGFLLELETNGITYAAISGHPDIFFNQTDTTLVAAPNLPESFKLALKKNGINFEAGLARVGTEYPATAHYNAVITDEFIFHNQKVTDQKILELSAGKRRIDVKQGYTRCNLIFITPCHAITSDEGIFKKLEKERVEVLFFNPKQIILPGFDHGFFGGTCGMLNKRLFLIGNPELHPDGRKLREFCFHAEIEMISLYTGPLYDGGGLFFLE